MSSDESYILDICDRVLGRASARQCRFDFLKGDKGHRFPIDAYYADLSLAVEYREIQHSQAVAFMDWRETVSGCSRGQQRRIYDERRRTVLPSQGIRLIELDYSDFAYGSRKRLLRERAGDEAVLRTKLEAFVKA
jgi:hypothetical protein